MSSDCPGGGDRLWSRIWQKRWAGLPPACASYLKKRQVFRLEVISRTIASTTPCHYCAPPKCQLPPSPKRLGSAPHKRSAASSRKRSASPLVYTEIPSTPKPAFSNPWKKARRFFQPLEKPEIQLERVRRSHPGQGAGYVPKPRRDRNLVCTIRSTPLSDPDRALPDPPRNTRRKPATLPRRFRCRKVDRVSAIRPPA